MEQAVDEQAPATDEVADEIDVVLADYLERVDRGERVDRQTLLDAHPQLAAELRAFFNLEQAVALETTNSHSADQASTNHGDLTIQCPHCRESVRLHVDAETTDVTCSCCGNHFSLVNRQEVTRTASTLTQMGRFDLVERIGVGGFGTVWKARDRELGRTVAVKVPRAQHFGEDSAERFLREARAAAHLRHPHIVSVHEVGREGETTYVVSDFVRGLTLAEWLTDKKPTFRQAAELVAKIADALHYAHEQGVVHRDLKPANVMIDAAGEPHILDFGLARREAADVTMTIEGQVLGTPAYMSPEQAKGEAHAADRRSDVYSLGAMLFEFLTGERPFRGNERMLLHHVIHDDPPGLRSLNRTVPKDLEIITLKCLEKAPATRYQASADLADDLRRWLRHVPIVARRTGRMRRFWRWYLPHSGLIAGGFTIVSAVISAFGTVMFPLITRGGMAEHSSAIVHWIRIACAAIFAMLLLGWIGVASFHGKRTALLIAFAVFCVWTIQFGMGLFLYTDRHENFESTVDQVANVNAAILGFLWLVTGTVLQLVALIHRPHPSE